MVQPLNEPVQSGTRLADTIAFFLVVTLLSAVWASGASYDAENRLLSILQGSTAVASYAYDAQGRRKTKTVGSTTTVYVTDADNREVLEYTSSAGQVQRWYSYGAGLDEPLNQMNVALGTCGTLIPDIQGSILATLDSGSGGLSKAGYLAYGENANAASGTYRYTARRLDPETVGSAAEPSGLYYYRARMYSPTLGRFMQADPVGYAAGVNLYAYVGNDPINHTDPTGLTLDQLGGQTVNTNSLLSSGFNTFNSLGSNNLTAANDNLTPAAQTLQGVAQISGYLNGSGGRWGGSATRALNDPVATGLENQGYTIIGGAGRASEEWIPGPGGGTLGGTFVDITAINGISTVRVQTITTLANGVTPTPAEAAAAARIQAAFPNDVLTLVPKQ